MDKRIDEATIDASLDAYLHGAEEGDSQRAQQLHAMLELMLLEGETAEGRMWLTDHGRMLLAEMHRQLSHCKGSGEQLKNTVLEAVQLAPHLGHWRDTSDYLRDLRIAITVANELCEQRQAGKEPNVTHAVLTVSERGEFGLPAHRIRSTYEEIASTVSGFKEIAHC